MTALSIIDFYPILIREKITIDVVAHVWISILANLAPQLLIMLLAVFLLYYFDISSEGFFSYFTRLHLNPESPEACGTAEGQGIKIVFC